MPPASEKHAARGMEDRLMSDRRLEERIRVLEKDVEELKALVSSANGSLRKNGTLYATAFYREMRDADSLREAEREMV